MVFTNIAILENIILYASEFHVKGTTCRWKQAQKLITLLYCCYCIVQVTLLLDGRTTWTFVITRSPQPSLFLLMKYETRIAATVTYLPNYIPHG